MIEISELVKRSGHSASALRYYEQRGLIQSVGRQGLRRVFKDDVEERLALIALGRAAGFSLEEIQDMFADSQSLEINRQKLTIKAEELDKKIKQLTVIRDGLRSTAACSAPSHMECPNFRRVLTAAGRGLIPPLGENEKPIKQNRRNRSK